MTKNRIWKIQFDTLADFQVLTSALVRSDLIDLKSAKINRIEVNYKRSCSKCQNQSDFELVLNYKKKFFSQFICYSCSIQAIADYFNSLFHFILLSSDEIKNNNIHIINNIRTKKQLIKHFQTIDLDFTDYYDNTITFAENLAHIKANYPGILELAGSHADFNNLKVS